MRTIETFGSVIVDYLYVAGSSPRPDETDAVSIVDSDAVLAAPVASERLEAIPRWDSQIDERLSRVERLQLSRAIRQIVGAQVRPRSVCGAREVDEIVQGDLRRAALVVLRFAAAFAESRSP